MDPWAPSNKIFLFFVICSFRNFQTGLMKSLIFSATIINSLKSSSSSMLGAPKPALRIS
jgi:hypothetical protein